MPVPTRPSSLFAALLGTPLLAALSLAACGDSDTTAEADTSQADVGTEDTAADTGAEADAVSAGPCDPSPERCAAADDSVQPPRLSEHGAAYDDANTRMIVFGGTTGVPDGCSSSVESQYLDTTWTYDDACGTWQTLEAAGPSARGRQAMTGGGGAAWLHGGRWRGDGQLSGAYTVLGDFWRFDFATSQWSEVTTSGAAPSARLNHSLVWDSTRERLLLFGGSEQTGLNIAPLNDVWAFDPTTEAWTELADGAGPDPRLSASAVYDASRDQLVVFGGFDDFGFSGTIEYFSDVWSFDLTTLEWSQLQNNVGGPDGRFGATLVHDTTADNYLMFAGHDDQQLGNRNDAWVFDPDTRAWQDLSIGDVFANPQTGVCDFPPDFTTIDAALPERRNYGTMVWSATCDHAVLFGGKTDCGAANDVWTYADEGFTEAFEASSGEVCVRFRDNPDNCANLCF